jgi:hypothetical protein
MKVPRSVTHRGFEPGYAGSVHAFEAMVRDTTSRIGRRSSLGRSQSRGWRSSADRNPLNRPDLAKGPLKGSKRCAISMPGQDLNLVSGSRAEIGPVLDVIAVRDESQDPLTGQDVGLRLQKRSVCRPACEHGYERTTAVTQCAGAEEQGNARRRSRLPGDACADAWPSPRPSPRHTDEAFRGVEQDVARVRGQALKHLPKPGFARIGDDDVPFQWTLRCFAADHVEPAARESHR